MQRLAAQTHELGCVLPGFAARWLKFYVVCGCVYEDCVSETVWQLGQHKRNTKLADFFLVESLRVMPNTEVCQESLEILENLGKKPVCRYAC